MCFSPDASFALGGALVPAGLYCVHSAWRKTPGLLPLAVIPLVFAAQQVAEGFVWLGLEASDPTRVRPAALAYLFFAIAFWPWWFSVVAAVMEGRPGRRVVFIALTVITSVWFWLLYYPVLIGPESFLTIEIAHHSIRYVAPDLWLLRTVPYPLLVLLYALSMTVPMILGPTVLRRVPLACLVLSALLTAVVFYYAFVSVWCFFAAVTSICLCVVFYRLPGTSGGHDAGEVD